MTVSGFPAGAAGATVAQSQTIMLENLAARLRGDDLLAAMVKRLGDLFLDYLRFASVGWAPQLREVMLYLHILRRFRSACCDRSADANKTSLP